jgi:hypothetical protein
MASKRHVLERWRTVLRLVAAGVLGAGVGACAPSERTPPPLVAPSPPAAVPAPPPEPSPPKPRPPKRVPASDGAPPIVLIGLSRPEVLATLGEPESQTTRGPGQAWVYRAGPCSVEVVFLMDVVRNELYAVDRRLGGTDGSPRAEQQCLRRIRAAHGS